MLAPDDEQTTNSGNWKVFSFSIGMEYSETLSDNYYILLKHFTLFFYLFFYIYFPIV